MFICRHPLRRANITRALPPPLTHTRLISAPRPALFHAVHARRFASPAVSDTAADRPAGGPSVLAATDTTPSHPSPPSPSDVHSPAGTAASQSEMPRYFQKDNTDAKLVAELPAAVVLEQLARGLRKKHNVFIERLARDVLKYYRGQQDSDRATVVAGILKVTEDRSQFRRYTIYALLKDLVDQGNLSVINTKTLATLTNAVMHRTPDPNCDALIYTTAAPLFLDALVLHREKPKAVFAAMTGGLTRQQVVWELFKIIRKLLALKRQDDVMPIFQTLANSGFVPEAAMQDLPTTGFAPIVLTVLLRTCMEWKWYTRAAYVLMNTPEWEQSRSPAFDRAVLEVVEHVLRSEEEPEPTLASAVVIRVLNNPEVVMLSNPTLRRFYALMEKYNRPDLAKAVYRVTQSPHAKAQHTYLPPSGTTLVWFMRALVAGQEVHLARMLLQQLVDHNNDKDVPALARPFLIHNAASLGFLTTARTLWERFSDDPAVRADGAVVVRMASAYHNRIRKLQSRMEAADRLPVSKPSGSILVSNAEAKAAASSSDASLEDVTVDKLGLSDSNEDPEDEHETRSLQEQIDDHRAFADLVVQTFRRAHEPLIRAAHPDLNALARAYMIQGRIEEGFEVLKVIVDRNEVPDVHDTNVALSALSVVDPARAAEMIDRMVDLGLHPDKVSFGTVIHRAVLAGDMPLATALILKARQLNIKQLSYKTIGSLIRACVAAPADQGLPNKTQLENVKDLVDSLLDADFVPSPAIGHDCVTAALRADDPVMAFRFWKLLVKDKVEWGDVKQKAKRARIAQRVRTHWRKELLDADRARVMLFELGEGPVLNVNARRQRNEERQRQEARSQQQG